MGDQSRRPRYGVRQEAAGQVGTGLVEGFKEWKGGWGGGRCMTVVERGHRPNRCCGGISGGEGLKN